MAYPGIEIKEIRLILDDEKTHCYVRAQGEGSEGGLVQGWHHKAFPYSRRMDDIIRETLRDDAFLVWPELGPP